MDPNDTRPSLLLRGCTILTRDPEVPDVQQGNIFVENGRIAAIGETLPIKPDVQVIDARGMITARSYRRSPACLGRPVSCAAS